MFFPPIAQLQIFIPFICMFVFFAGLMLFSLVMTYIADQKQKSVSEHVQYMQALIGSPKPKSNIWAKIWPPAWAAEMGERARIHYEKEQNKRLLMMLLESRTSQHIYRDGKTEEEAKDLAVREIVRHALYSEMGEELVELINENKVPNVLMKDKAI